MRAFIATALAITLLTVPAYAQRGGGKRGGQSHSTEQKKPKVDEKAYKAALERIPEPKEKYDPWGVARPAEPAKKSK